ncbi:hypothetical protein DVH24_027683, partial [Malus domestica]
DLAFFRNTTYCSYFPSTHQHPAQACSYTFTTPPRHTSHKAILLFVGLSRRDLSPLKAYSDIFNVKMFI